MGAENRPGFFGKIINLLTPTKKEPQKTLEELMKPTIGNLHKLLSASQKSVIELKGRKVSMDFFFDLHKPDAGQTIKVGDEIGNVELKQYLPKKTTGEFRCTVVNQENMVNFFLSNDPQNNKSPSERIRVSTGTIGKDRKVTEGPSFRVIGGADSLIELTPADSSQGKGINAEETTNLAKQAYGFIVAGYEEKRK